jgi:ppGpp synthetase/RelA/SpoT-type nucleotidyltranferase
MLVHWPVGNDPLPITDSDGVKRGGKRLGLIEEFIARYRREFDYYDQTARLVAQTLDANLQSAGIRSMVTSRAKSHTRLEAKVRQRARTKTYTTLEEISADVVDLAGARVALYFPGERDQVDRLVKQLFSLLEPPKEFPTNAKTTYKKRFSGYWATHYRVQFKESSLGAAQQRYTEARVEIQVASVLMHAWSEVEHDLVYKPFEGTLSDEEYAILDELNGLVMAGEIALERLQRAGEVRESLRPRLALAQRHGARSARAASRFSTWTRGSAVRTAQTSQSAHSGTAKAVYRIRASRHGASTDRRADNRSPPRGRRVAVQDL